MGIPPGNFDVGGAPPPDPIDPFPPPATDPAVSLIFAILNFIAAVINSIILAIERIVKALIGIFRALGKFLLHIWQKYIVRAITWLATHVQKLRAWLKRTISPILKRLQKIKQWYDQHILKQQLRMLQTIQAIRRVLGILRLFHVKWAAKLDNSLADLQNRIEISIAIVRGTLNQIINTLALVLDPSLLITRNVLGASLLANLGAIKRIFGYGDNRILSASEQATIDKQHALYFTATVNAHLNALAASGPTQDDKDNRKAARQALSDAIGAPLPF